MNYSDYQIKRNAFFNYDLWGQLSIKQTRGNAQRTAAQ